MSTLYISEYDGLAATDQGDSVSLLGTPIVEQTVTVSAATARSNPFNANTRFIEFTCDGIMSFEIGPSASVVAAVTNMRATAGEKIIRRVQANNLNLPPGATPGATFALAAITNT